MGSWTPYSTRFVQIVGAIAEYNIGMPMTRIWEATKDNYLLLAETFSLGVVVGYTGCSAGYRKF